MRICVEGRQCILRQVEQRLPVPITEIQFFPFLVRVHVQPARGGQCHGSVQRAQPRRADHPLPGKPAVGLDQFLWQAGQLRRIAAACAERERRVRDSATDRQRQRERMLTQVREAKAEIVAVGTEVSAAREQRRLVTWGKGQKESKE